MKPEELRNLKNYYCAYRTGNKVGIVKTPRPPFARKLEPTARPKRKSKGWFPLESYQPA
jgi:hypothetical protein